MIPRLSVKIKKINENAIIPTYGSENAAGMDFYASHDVVIPAGVSRLVGTSIAIQLPNWLYLQLFSRSGLALKSGVTVNGGVIDSDYRGEIGVILHNSNDCDFTVTAGDRIAQGVVLPCYKAVFEEVDKLDPTERGSGGFGSTGN